MEMALENLPEAVRRAILSVSQGSPISDEEFAEMRIRRANSFPGTLKGLNCDKCLNRGVIYALKDGREVVRECECMPRRRSMRAIRESGLEDSLEAYTFDAYQVREPWQAQVKEAAERYAKDPDSQWFYIGGNSGCGKTHICTAICGEMLQVGKHVRYMLWASDIRRLKSVVNDDAYDRLFSEYAEADVLYIDDLFKVKEGAELSPADVQRTYELINARYIHRDKPTIVSSERSIADLISVDEATGSRIYSRCKGYTFELGKDARKNWRLYGGD